MTDINLLPQNLRYKKEPKEPKPDKQSVEFVHQKKKQDQSLDKPALKLKQDQNTGVHKTENTQLAKPQKPPKPQRQLRLKLNIIIKKIKNLPQVLKSLIKKKKGAGAKLSNQEQAPQKKSGGLSVDLLKEEIVLQRSSKPELIKLLLAGVIIAFLTSGIVFAYRHQYKNIKRKITELQKELSDLDQKASGLEQARESLVKDSDKLIKTVDVLLKNRINWLAFLGQIENITLRRVYYTNLKAPGFNRISISAHAKTMEDALLQIKIFKQSSDFVDNVELKNISVETEEVTREGDGREESFINSFVDFNFEFNVQPAWIIKNQQS